jgi:hypothetical protein
MGFCIQDFSWAQILRCQNARDPITDKHPTELDRVAQLSIIKQNPSQISLLLNI